MISTISFNHNSEYGGFDYGDDYIIAFEISFRFGDICRHRIPLYQMIGEFGKIWFSGSIGKRTGKVVSSNFGRIGQTINKA